VTAFPFADEAKQRRKPARVLMGPLALAAFLGTAVSSIGGTTESPFAAEVISYSPAPGQFVRDSSFGDPSNALGPPEGMGIQEPNNETVVTLGGFGGTIILGFDHTVEDHPLNPMGLDAIVFGNAFWFLGNSDRHWAECATIEISLDANGNGLADDAWYLIPGSHIADSPGPRATATWDDDVGDATYPPAQASWIPPGESGVWTTSAFALPFAPFGAEVVVNPFAGSGNEGIFGYADYSPTLVLGDFDADDVVDDAGVSPDEFYTVPDDPFEVGVSLGSGGGDAFDIAWAVDPETGEPAELPGFDFIRLTTSVNAISRLGLGEKSAEIDAVADAAIDPLGDFDGDEDIDLADVAGFQRCLLGAVDAEEACHIMAREGGVPELSDWTLIVERLTGPHHAGTDGS